jgi:Domain of unknown function (DUF4112)
MPPERDPAAPHRADSRPVAPLADKATPAWAFTLVRILDDALFIPGTRIGVGLDAILGFLLPGVGDALTGLASLSLLVLGFQRRVPKVVLLRMVFNILLDSLVGAIPVAGDAFDLFWRSNRKNLELLRRYDKNPKRAATTADYLVVGLGIAVAVAAIALPIALGFVLLRWLWHFASR